MNQDKGVKVVTDRQIEIAFQEWVDQEDFRLFYRSWKSVEAMGKFWQYLNHKLLAESTPKTLTSSKWHGWYTLALARWVGD